MLTGHRRLDRGVEGEQVCLICNVFDDTHDFADFIRTLAQTFDFLRCFLDILTNKHHAINGLSDSHLTGAGITQRVLSRFSAQLCISRNVLNEDSQRFYSFSGLRNLCYLGFGGLSQFSGAIEDAAGCMCDLQGSALDSSNDFSKLFDHIVEGVSQNAKCVGSYFGLYTQVTITDCADFLEQFFDLCLQGGCFTATAADASRWGTARYEALTIEQSVEGHR